MLLRYAALHGRIPVTEADWTEYRAWKQKQLDLPECCMCSPESSPSEHPCCATCAGRPGCPKRPNG